MIRFQLLLSVSTCAATPREIKRTIAHPIGFYGSVGADGVWAPGQSIRAVAYDSPIPGRGLHSSTFQLNLSALYGIEGARRGCVARFKEVSGDV
jgi:hypothetical protein